MEISSGTSSDLVVVCLCGRCFHFDAVPIMAVILSQIQLNAVLLLRRGNYSEVPQAHFRPYFTLSAVHLKSTSPS